MSVREASQGPLRWCTKLGLGTCLCSRLDYSAGGDEGSGEMIGAGDLRRVAERYRGRGTFKSAKGSQRDNAQWSRNVEIALNTGREIFGCS